jgi:hypothetical protein
MYKKRDRKLLFSQTSNSLSYSKKGQVTVFIILGILLLLALILVLTLKSEIFAFKTNEIIPTEKGKVENFLVTCMDKIGDDALLKIGVQGGYIEVPEQISRDQGRSLVLSPFTSLPYWAIGPTTYIPSLEEIKERMDLYMEENLRECLFGMEAFNQKYDLIEKSEITADTKILDTKVIFGVHWDIEVKNKAGEVVSEVIDHIAESPVKLKRLHETAVRVLEKEMANLKLEDITQDLIALEHPDVPVNGIELRCSKKTWNIEKVETTLMDMLRVNVRELKVKGTDFVEFPDDFPYYQNHYVWDIGEGLSDEVGVMFNFDDQTYPYSFSVTPSNGKRMQSSQLGGDDLLSFLCLQTWKFTYDLVYPVTVRLRDETTGYDFNMGFTVHLIRNTPSKGDPVPRASALIPSVNEEDYCRTSNIPMTVKTSELVENGQGVSFTEDLGDVNLSLTCLRYRCESGTSEYDYAGLGYAGTITNFPYCVGGILRGEKENYKEDWERVVTSPDKEIELQLTPTLEWPATKISVVKHKFSDEIETFLPPAEELGQKEAALIKLTFARSNSTESNLKHDSNIIVSKDIGAEVQADEKLELLGKADFTYYLEIMAFEEETFVGGYKGEITIPWAQLKDGNELVFHILSEETSNEEKMFEFMGNLEQHSKFIPALEIR